jgi:hypothetical protein
MPSLGKISVSDFFAGFNLDQSGAINPRTAFGSTSGRSQSEIGIAQQFCVRQDLDPLFCTEIQDLLHEKVTIARTDYIGTA